MIEDSGGFPGGVWLSIITVVQGGETSMFGLEEFIVLNLLK